MFRIDTPDAVGGRFSDGNPQIGQVGTLVPAAWLNDVQEGLCKLVEHAGLTLAKGDNDLVWQAVVAIATGVAGTGGGPGSVPTTRAIGTSGLLTGGHALDSDLALAVPKANSADVKAGTESAKAITPDLLGALFSIANPASLPSEIAITLPGGFQVRIGQHAATMGEGMYAVNFGTPFDNAGLFFFTNPINATASDNRDVWMQRVGISAAQMTVFAQWTGASGTSRYIDGFDYIAFGL